MPSQNETPWDGMERPSRRGLAATACAMGARALEAEADRWFVWLPVFFAAGIVTYFALPDEPGGRLAVAGVLAACGLAITIRRLPLGLAVGGALLAFTLGFATAKARTEMVRAPVLATEVRYVTVTGYVEEYEARADKRDRLTLRVIAISDLKAEARPYRVRITTSAKSATAVTGEAVSVRATLSPPPEPVEPGGFDFGRRAWFERLGATGYATGRITPLTDAQPPPRDLRVWSAIDAVRGTVNARVRAALPGETGAIAMALMTGDRGGIPQAVTDAMRDSGLAHVLAISGLHMVIMAGTVFWLAVHCLPSSPGSPFASPSKNGRRPSRCSPPPSTWHCLARGYPPCAPGS